MIDWIGTLTPKFCLPETSVGHSQVYLPKFDWSAFKVFAGKQC